MHDKCGGCDGDELGALQREKCGAGRATSCLSIEHASSATLQVQCVPDHDINFRGRLLQEFGLEELQVQLKKDKAYRSLQLSSGV